MEEKIMFIISSKSSSKNQFWFPSGTMSPKSRGMFLTRQSLNGIEPYFIATTVQVNPCRSIFTLHIPIVKGINSRQQIRTTEHFLRDIPTAISAHTEPHLQECHA
ncbi:hypothetical protein GOODEAATRI_011775 [Goodea atripinnis]|uniref:Uncharacterized protein n=1 Tax=Goodea atripinnis TaxID=208336 RepID=A0ABV0NTT1_9TELE